MSKNLIDIRGIARYLPYLSHKARPHFHHLCNSFSDIIRVIAQRDVDLNYAVCSSKGAPNESSLHPERSCECTLRKNCKSAHFMRENGDNFSFCRDSYDNWDAGFVDVKLAFQGVIGEKSSWDFLKTVFAFWNSSYGDFIMGRPLTCFVWLAIKLDYSLLVSILCEHTFQISNRGMKTLYLVFSATAFWRS